MRSPKPRRRCPFVDCPSHDQPRSKGIVRHGFMKSRQGSRLRLLCRTCKRTFCGRRGTAYYRLQRPRSTFDQFARLATEGSSCASMARTLDVCPGTVRRWLERAGKHARAFGEEHDRVDEPKELQFDEISARPASQPRTPWVFNAIEVGTRYWAASIVGTRSHRTARALALQARQTCAKRALDVVITSDPFPYYVREFRRTFGPGCVYAQVRTRYRQNLCARTEMIVGSRDRLDEHLSRSEDSKKPNTAYIERLHLFLRRSCVYLPAATAARA